MDFFQLGVITGFILSLVALGIIVLALRKMKGVNKVHFVSKLFSLSIEGSEDRTILVCNVLCMLKVAKETLVPSSRGRIKARRMTEKDKQLLSSLNAIEEVIRDDPNTR